MAVGRVAGWQSIKSTAFDVDRTGSGYRFKGRGFGHGVGLCVVGAGRRASQGATAEEILKFYFPGLTIGSVGSPSTDRRRRAALARRRGNGATPRLAAGGRRAGAAGRRRERAAGAAVARCAAAATRSRKSTGITAPARLRITVHPSVESFGRATGQPWWVSGATDGAAIDLLPITILRQQGQLDRTIRHEVTHALLDATLAKRPMWVREGAAAYFAAPAKARDRRSRTRVDCPSDAELLRPVSAGAQREAYARAEACFARGSPKASAGIEIR